MLCTFVSTFHFVAGDTLPVGVAHTMGPTSLLVLLACAVDARVTARIRAVLTGPEGGADALLSRGQMPITYSQVAQ